MDVGVIKCQNVTLRLKKTKENGEDGCEKFLRKPIVVQQHYNILT